MRTLSATEFRAWRGGVVAGIFVGESRDHERIQRCNSASSTIVRPHLVRPAVPAPPEAPTVDAADQLQHDVGCALDLLEVDALGRVGPLAKLRAAAAAHAVADRQERLEAVVLDLAGNLALPLGSNYPESPDGCLATALALVEAV